jgi:integrase
MACLTKGLAVLLEDFVIEYLNARPVSEGYSRTIKKRMAKLSEFAGHTDLKSLFNEATINGFLAALDGLSPFTKNKYRADFLALWRAAADVDKVPYPQARRIRRERTVAQVIECYLEHEARSLVVAAEHLVGAYPNGVARRQYWPAIIRAAWDSGLRRGDLWRLKAGQIRKDKTAVIVQSKTGQTITCRFHPSTVKAIARASGHLEWVLCEWCFGVHFQEIVTLTGIQRGTFRWLRRGSGSRIEADHPGRGPKHLGNTPGVFGRHYDAQLGAVKKPMPPEL